MDANSDESEPTGEVLLAALRELGVAEGDVVMPHVSLRRVGIGRSGPGAATLVEALDAAVGADGTVLMMAGPADPFGWVNEMPEYQRIQWLRAAEAFDCRRDPCDPDIGAFAEVFRTTPGTVVSDHPEGRFAARGRHAADLVTEVPWDDYYGAGSPLERFVGRGGKVVRLGADDDTVTLIHYAEYLADVPGKARLRRHRVVKAPIGAGSVVRTIECLDDSQGIVAGYEGPDYFGVIVREYVAGGRAQVGRVGSADAQLFDAADLVAFASRRIEELAS
ncbi:MAG: aminoglycoside N(3)-acetyltransferase [Acidimicrobiia bacterium]